MFNVYWNNICLVTRMEEQYIKSKQIDKASAINAFKFSYYGLGRKQSMRDHVRGVLAQEEDCDPKGDILVTTDLEVFQNSTYANYFLNYKKTNLPWDQSKWIKAAPSIEAMHPRLKPFIIIPLVMVAKRETPAAKLKSFKELAQSSFTYSYGGPINSAGESLLRTLGSLYGDGFVQGFKEKAKVASMPAQAFQFLNAGLVDVAIVPTIFAMRQGAIPLQAIWPEEGAIAIPSFVAVSADVPQSIIDDFSQHFLSREFQELLVRQADIIPTHPDVLPSEFALKHDVKLAYPQLMCP